MKKVSIKIFMLLAVFFVMGFLDRVYAIDGRITEDVGSVIIPFEKKWEDVLDEVRPSQITVKLYKYIGEFDEESAILVESADVKKADGWKYNFDISNESLFDENNNAYKFKVVEEVPVGFREVAHQDANVIFNPPMTSNEWDRITPCNEIDIQTTGDFKTVLVAKMTGNQGNIFIAWTVDALSESERLMIYNSTKGINGFGNPNYSQYVFISGTTGEYYNKNQKVLTVDTEHIYFEGESKVWSLFAVGTYRKSSTEANASYITNGINLIDIMVRKEWNDYNNILGLRPSSIKISLLQNGLVYRENIILNSPNWEYKFTGLPEYDKDGNKYEYSVSETDNLNGYTAQISKKGDYEYIITNTYEVKPTTVTVTKEWVNVSQFESLPGVIVGLYYKKTESDEFTKIAEATLSDLNDWTYTFTKGDNSLEILPDNYIYAVYELGYDVTDEEKKFYEEFFITDYKNDGNNYTITNTCTSSFILPDTGSSGTLILLVVVTMLLGVPVVYLIYSFIRGKGIKLVPIK